MSVITEVVTVRQDFKTGQAECERCTVAVERASVIPDLKGCSLAPPPLKPPPATGSLAPALEESVATTKVEYRQVGRSGLRVSNPILGTLGFGDRKWMPWCIERDEASRLLFEAYSRGINTWDTANAYSNGLSESIIGHCVAQYGIPRRKLILMTKVGRITADPDTSEPGDFVAFSYDAVSRSKDYCNQYGLSRAAILNSVEESLERLQTTYIDVLFVHRYDDSVPPEETMEALHHLVTSGKVRYIAASSMWAYEFASLQAIAERHSWTKFIAMQNHYNLIYREEEREMIRYCKKTGVGLLPWSPLAEGQLARPSGQRASSIRSMEPNRFGNGQSCADREVIARVHHVAQKMNWTMSQVALAWLNKRTTAPIIGLHSTSRMDEALAIRGQLLSSADEAYLEAPYQPKNVQGHS